jgi:asparagine synthase (glutamine-hydrolysing)
MCGFAGIINLSGSDIESSNEVSNMASFIAHRGPDESSVFHGGPVVMAFQRLSIIDLETGGQPMSDATGSITCMLNGEIYNYIEIREQLKNNGSIFRTNSDTEVILHLYKQYGIEFVTHLRGMFAIALWDRENNLSFIASIMANWHLHQN